MRSESSGMGKPPADPSNEDYSTIVVGSDGSPSSLLAVRRAARLAAAFDAELIIACAYYEPEDTVGQQECQSEHPVVGQEHADSILQPACEEARALGVQTVAAAMETGSPVAALMRIVSQHDADVLVVGNRGINTLTGRLLGSVPADIARQSDCDVIIVHTVA